MAVIYGARDIRENSSVPITVTEFQGNNSLNVAIKSVDGGLNDAFGRLRVGEPYGLFDIKQISDYGSLFFNEALNGTGSSYYDQSLSQTVLLVGSNTDFAIRQTRQRFNYQPGKSQLIMMTGVMSNETNVNKRIGYFSSGSTSPFNSGLDGLYFQSNGSSVSVCQAINGSVSEYHQPNWNIDPLDGTGASGRTLNWDKSQIFLIDFEWLGVGRTRFGVVMEGAIYYVHDFKNANSGSTVYMRSPNQPLRYEIRSVGGTGSLQQICSSVQSEGGQEDIGQVRAISTGNTIVDADLAGSVYCCMAFQLRPEYNTAVIKPISNSIMLTTNDDFEWMLILNPTIGSTLTYNNINVSALKYAVGSVQNTLTDGIILNSGYGTSFSAQTNVIPSTINMGTKINGSSDTLVLAVRPFSAGADVRAGLTWRELN